MTSDGPQTPASATSVGTAPPRTNDGVFARVRLVGVLTLASRALGLIRDIGMAALFGNSAVMDAFSVAFRIPNLVRQLFGEGALNTAFLPVLIREMEQNGRESAWKLASAVLVLLAVTLCILVALAELVLWGVAHIFDTSSETNLLLGLTAVMLPYLVLICLAAQVSAIQHALNHFTWPALVSVLLNAIWIVAIAFAAYTFESPVSRVYAISVCIVFGGFVQFAAPLPMLRRLGFVFQTDWRTSRTQIVEIVSTMVPVLLGLSITQLNTFADSLIAWAFSQPASGAATMNLPGHPAYPLQEGAASALYFGQRIYQFPLGVFGVALGTVMFPLFARHAGQGQMDRLRDALSLGLRLVIGIGLPASIGIILLAKPLTVLFFERGEFSAADTEITAGIIAAYGLGVWAYCGLLIVHRGFYAVGDRVTPLRVGMVAVAINLVLNFVLIWPLKGKGLALATAISAMVQVSLVTWLLQKRVGRLDWSSIVRATLKTLVATAAMSVVCLVANYTIPAGDATWQRLLHLGATLAAGIGVYLAVAHFIGLPEPWQLLGRKGEGAQEFVDLDLDE